MLRNFQDPEPWASGGASNEEYDAIWFGGGAAGRFGAAFHKGLGGKPLIVEKHALGGECHVCRCAFENFFADQASMAKLMRLYSGKSWYCVASAMFLEAMFLEGLPDAGRARTAAHRAGSAGRALQRGVN